MSADKILVVGTDAFTLDTVMPALQNNGYQVTRAEHAVTAVEKLSKKGFDLVITDLLMDSINGFAVLKKARKRQPPMGVIYLTEYADMRLATESFSFEADDYLIRPCEPDEILFRAYRCLQKNRRSVEKADRNRTPQKQPVQAPKQNAA